jgi:hypothetical protein
MKLLSLGSALALSLSPVAAGCAHHADGAMMQGHSMQGHAMMSGMGAQAGAPNCPAAAPNAQQTPPVASGGMDGGGMMSGSNNGGTSSGGMMGGMQPGAPPNCPPNAVAQTAAPTPAAPSTTATPDDQHQAHHPN